MKFYTIMRYLDRRSTCLAAERFHRRPRHTTEMPTEACRVSTNFAFNVDITQIRVRS